MPFPLRGGITRRMNRYWPRRSATTAERICLIIEPATKAGEGRLDRVIPVRRYHVTDFVIQKSTTSIVWLRSKARRSGRPKFRRKAVPRKWILSLLARSICSDRMLSHASRGEPSSIRTHHPRCVHSGARGTPRLAHLNLFASRRTLFLVGARRVPAQDSSPR